MRELKKEEWLKSAFDFLIIESSGKMHPSAKQAYQQIKALIREDNVKRDMIIDNRLGIKKKEVTEEWLKEKATNFVKELAIFVQDFIRSFVKEIHGRK